MGPKYTVRSRHSGSLRKNVAPRCSIVWTSPVPMTGSSFGCVMRTSNVVMHSAPMRSLRET